jgi:hypothetical protein
VPLSAAPALFAVAGSGFRLTTGGVGSANDTVMLGLPVVSVLALPPAGTRFEPPPPPPPPSASISKKLPFCTPPPPPPPKPPPPPPPPKYGG